MPTKFQDDLGKFEDFEILVYSCAVLRATRKMAHRNISKIGNQNLVGTISIS